MEFELTEEHKMFQKLGRDFADREIEPVAEEIEKESRVPEDMLGKLAAVGLLGIAAPEKYGGLGAGFLTYILAVEQIHYPCTPCSWLLVANEFADVLSRVGTEGQKAGFLPSAVEGRLLPGWFFADEIDGVGPAALNTTAHLDKGHWVINGTKRFHTFGHVDGPTIIFARTGKGEVSSFLVSKNISGYTSSKPMALLGLRGLEIVDTYLHDVRVPEDSLLGERGKGLAVAQMVAVASRLRQAIQSVACAQRALDEAVKYSKERTCRGVPIASMQAIQWLLAEMAMRIEPARWSTYEVAWSKEQGEDTGMQSAMLKLFAARTAKEVANMAIQVHGCYGLTKDYRIERIYRQAKMFELTEGSKDAQASIVADALLAR
jgi:alkylation response protein AidB-like acyl-CoA dehydrogenase